MPLLQQVWHVLRKDLHAQRWWLLLYTVLLLPATAPVWWPLTSPLAAPNELGNSLLSLSTLVAACAAFYQAFRADAPIGDLSQWRTLPLAPSAVFGAKLTFIGVLTLLLPVATHVPAWWRLGVSWSQAVDATLQFGGLSLLLLLVALLSAALRSGALVVAVLALLLILNEAWKSALDRFVGAASWSGSPTIVALMATALILTLIVWRTYERQLNSGRARAALVVSGAVALLVPNAVRSAPGASQTLPASFAGITVDVHTDSVRVQPSGVRVLPLRVTLAPAPTDVRLAMYSAVRERDECPHPDHASQFSAVPSPQPGYRSVLPKQLTWRSAWRTDGARAASERTVTIQHTVRLATGTSACAMKRNYYLSVTRDSLIARLPASHGSRQRIGGREFAVEWPNDHPEHLAIALRVTALSGQGLIRNPPVRLSVPVGERPPLSIRHRLVLVHEQRREAIDPRPLPMVDEALETLSIAAERIYTVPPDRYNGPDLTSWTSLQFSSEAEGRQWLSEATLYVIEERTESVNVTDRVRTALTRSLP